MRPAFIKPVTIISLAAIVTLAAFTYKINKETAPSTATEEVPYSNPPGYRWTRLTPNAEFAKNYNFQLLTLQNKLWAFHPDGNYYSADGKQWTKSSLPNSINNLAFLDYVAYNNSVLGLGHFTGNIERYQLTTPITQTTDLHEWKTLAKKSNLPRRFFYHPFVFNGKIWIIGGTDGTRDYDDAWTSTDGVNWTRAAEHLPFGPRHHQSFVTFKNKLFMLDDNEVWSSADGINWKMLTDKIVDAQLFGFTAVVFDEKIWLLGCNRNQQFSSEILVSSDGIHWEMQDAPWSPRGGIAATVFNGKLYLTGGKYGGFRKGTTETEFVYSNDVWMLEKVK